MNIKDILKNQKNKIKGKAKKEIFESLIITCYFENLANEAVEIDGLDTNKNWLKHYKKVVEQYANLINNHSLAECYENLGFKE